MPTRTVFLDTSFVIALVNSDDAHHERAKTLDTELIEDDVQLLLHWGILLEIGDGFAGIDQRKNGAELVDSFLSEDAYSVIPLSSGLILASLELFKGRQDKDWGLTDGTSFVLMDQVGITEALTADHHFVQAGYRALLLAE